MWDKIFVVIFLVTIVSEYVLLPREVFYLFIPGHPGCSSPTSVVPPGWVPHCAPWLWCPCCFATCVLLSIHVLWPPLQDSPQNGHLDCNTAVPSCPHSFHILPWLHPLAHLDGNLANSLAHEDWQNTSPSCVRLDGRGNCRRHCALLCSLANPGRHDNLVGMSHALHPDGLDCNKLAT
jgi:hypothetical protein